MIADGRISGEVDVRVLDAEKGSVSLEVMRSIGVTAKQTAAVGDSESDVQVAEAVGLAVAYDSASPDLDRVAHVCLRRGELRRLIDVIDRES